MELGEFHIIKEEKDNLENVKKKRKLNPKNKNIRAQGLWDQMSSRTENQKNIT